MQIQRIFRNIVAVWALLILALPVAMVGVANADDLGDAAKCGSNIDFDSSAQCKQNNKQASKDAFDACVRSKKSGTAQEKKDACTTETSSSGQLESLIKSVLNILSAVVGIVAVIMVIVGGLKYVVSSGDSNSASSAKNTILYALIGIVIAVVAQIIVQFVLERTT